MGLARRRLAALPHGDARDVAEGRERKQARMEAAKPEQKKSATRAPPRIEAAAAGGEKSERVEKERQVRAVRSAQGQASCRR